MTADRPTGHLRRRHGLPGSLGQQGLLGAAGSAPEALGCSLPSRPVPTAPATCRTTLRSVGTLAQQQTGRSRRCAKLSLLPHFLHLQLSGSGHAGRCGPKGRLGSEGTGAREATLLCVSWKQNPHLFPTKRAGKLPPSSSLSGESLSKRSPASVRPTSLWCPGQPDP